MIQIWSFLLLTKTRFVDFRWYFPLTLFHMSVGHYGPTYHESVCCFHRNRARFTKILDFVPLHIWLIPSKPFLEFFFEIFKKLNVQNFRGSSSMSWKIEKIEKNPFFFKKSYFFWLNLFCIHSQLSFEVHCSIVAQKLRKFEISSLDIPSDFGPL